MFLYRITFILILISAVITIRAQETCQHTVMRGETFASVAKKYGITEAQLKDANPKHKTCYVGLKLTVPIVSQPTSNAPATNVEQETQVSRNALSAQSLSVTADNNRTSAGYTKKKKKSFWKSLGEIASDVGDVVVGVASGLNETGLIDKTGNAGALIGGTADIVNMSRGTQSNFLGAATKGEYNGDGSGENTVVTDVSLQNNADLAALKNRRNQLQARLNQINAQITAELKSVSGSKAGASGRNLKNKMNSLRNSPLENERKSINNEIYNLNTQIAALEGRSKELEMEREERRQAAKQESQRLKEKRKNNNPILYHMEQKAKDAARDVNDDILANPGKWIDAHGVKGTVDIYERNLEIQKKKKK